MNKALALAALCTAAQFCVAPLLAQSFDPDAVIAVTIREDGSTNVWTAADAFNALGMMNRKYWREMESEIGRREWHGAPTGSFIDTNALIRVTTYHDGFAWTNKWTRPKSAIERKIELAQLKADALRAKAASAPPRLAELYLRQAETILDIATNEVKIVTEEISAN